ncbi:telomere repeats-binding bouquet formation protein 1 [Xenopus tropicalis]|uniref:Telomere repeat binding bouquet formation protein 1 n=1 Tax=Xenopus tropicalis TaxID=8364 RepID=A0A6I8PVQ7_XENTR|nr:telomere repeats-binding bouquet formation protein 1 [Xenopus tropicalis]
MAAGYSLPFGAGKEGLLPQEKEVGRGSNDWRSALSGVTCGLKRNFAEMKTDVNLLLDCLKFQIDNPQSQKGTLAAICSICQENTIARDYFRDIGGLSFVSILAKTSPHVIVKDAALFTLGVLAESCVFCQQTLCTLETFEDICSTLLKEESSLNLKRMSLYLFMVLVSNNRAGQTHSRISGCIDVLLCLFREMPSSCNIDVPNRAKNWSYQLWSSVCSGLCACVNNPQNDENQKLCCSVFPQAKDLLKHSNDPEIVRPVCSFISFVVADNSFVQEYFASIGGLDTLADLFLQLVSNLQRRSSKLAVVVMKTVVACTANNTTCINCLSKYNIISCMLTLLTSEPLDPEDKCAVVLAIGRCTENCEGNQYELLKSNGLPVIIQILTESQNEQQLHKAATFVLQNCKNITNAVSIKLPQETTAVSADKTREKQMFDYWKKNIYKKREHLEKQHEEENVRRQIFSDVTLQHKAAASTFIPVGNISGDNQAEPEENHMDLPCRDLDCNSDTSINNAPLRDPVLQTKQHNMNKKHYDEQPSDKRVQELRGNKLFCRINYKETRSINSRKDTFKQTLTFSGDKSKAGYQDPLTLCKDIIDKEICTILTSEITSDKSRCTGCLATELAMNSRNCTSILRDSSFLCDHHMVIVEAEEQYKRELKKLLQINENLLTPLKKGGMSYEKFLQSKSGTSRFLLTPLKTVKSSAVTVKTGGGEQDRTHKSACLASNPDLDGTTRLSGNTPTTIYFSSKNPSPEKERKKERGPRRNFTQSEVAYLLDGVQKFGPRWNSILWSYPFLKGRTNVNLSKKYKQLQKNLL